MQARRIGLISDTHGLLRPEALHALAGSDLILHAGDVGDSAILQALGGVAPVIAVRGNVDTEAWAKTLPHSITVEVGPMRLHLVHRLQDVELDGRVDVVVTGHSHKPAQEYRDGVLYLNPGSAGPRRFSLPVTVARLDLNAHPLQMELIAIAAGTDNRSPQSKPLSKQPRRRTRR